MVELNRGRFTDPFPDWLKSWPSFRASNCISCRAAEKRDMGSFQE